MKRLKLIIMAIGVLLSFLFWTFLVSTIDVQAIGANGTSVGFATMNNAVHRFLGVHLFLYTLTDWLSLIPIACVAFLAGLGLTQWIQRKKLSLVDKDILYLGAFYGIVFLVYLLFELVVINYRPILIEGKLEASYPSSTTMLVLCLVPTFIREAKHRLTSPALVKIITIGLNLFCAFMVIARLVSGVHWCSDIIAGILLSIGLTLGFYAIVLRKCEE